MAPDVPHWPRRTPGRLMIDGKALKYADLHSFYYQTRQIFGEFVYDFDAGTDAPSILDCGAHIGLASLFFKELYPMARIRAYEADATVAGLCAYNMGEFGHDVSVTAAAVWTHCKGVAFAASMDDAGHVAAGGNVRVPTVRLRDEIGDGPVDLLKLDIEGAEFTVLADCGDALRNVRRMIAEVHGFRPEEGRVGDFLSLLEAQGFRYGFADLQQAKWYTPAERPPFSVLATDKYIFTVYAWR